MVGLLRMDLVEEVPLVALVLQDRTVQTEQTSSADQVVVVVPVLAPVEELEAMAESLAGVAAEEGLRKAEIPEPVVTALAVN